ncbi:hypothetical protein BSFA1_10480 [Burkholderia sp. SFA1]|nr:hypothetical protein BSFA1_10480 [Burkholderia sp. SFA1]
MTELTKEELHRMHERFQSEVLAGMHGDTESAHEAAWQLRVRLAVKRKELGRDLTDAERFAVLGDASGPIHRKNP